VQTITAIKAQKKRGRASLFLDGAYAFSLSIPAVAELGLRRGQQLSPDDIERSQHADVFHRAWDSALRLLGSRPRGEQELRTRLNAKGFDTNTVAKVLAKLGELSLVDDAAFARLWTENREAFNPRSRRLIQMELRQKGVDAETIAQATAGVDDEVSAYRAAGKKLASLTGVDYPQFRKKVVSFLGRRGFSYEVIASTLSRLWQEHSARVGPHLAGGEERDRK